MKVILKKFKKVFFVAVVLMLMAAYSIFILSACESDYEKLVKQGALQEETGIQESSDSSNAGDDTTAQDTNDASGSSGEDNESSGSDNKNTEETADGEKGGNDTTASTAEDTGDQARQTIVVTATTEGYSPEKINAKAGQPTILVMQSVDAYGCERAFVIPQLKIYKILPENGNTAFDLGVQEKGASIVGVCSMGMYYFEIFFN
ncbi:MAG: hypothetical protein FJW66_09015 [Actinobacteria bacterium]|nr:hypothetical protein [Actinomycetota bacterium]